GDAQYVFVANYDLERDSGYFGLPALDPAAVLVAEFSTDGPIPEDLEPIRHNGFFHRIENLEPGEGRVYRVVPD
ncbi:MAG: hypothetical protein HKN01_10575, partial [Acidimicrobiia bacterium]|nr:hypothetical protein [Acidimicrobiia bacterium]